MFSRHSIWPSRLFAAVLCLLVFCNTSSGQTSPPTGTTHFVFDGNRIYAELGFVYPDGSIHKTLAFVDMGSPDMVLTEPLFTQLQVDQNKPLLFCIGDLAVTVPSAQVSSEHRKAHSIGPDLLVEAVLPASVLQRYQVVIDYQKKTLTLAQPGVLKPRGVPVPFQINEKTGLIAIDATIGGSRYSITIDNGSAYTWVRESAAKPWVATHPDWERGVGAVGASNMMMSGDGTEISGKLLRISQISINSLVLKNAGVLAAGPSQTFPGNLDLFDWYSKKNAGTVIGWIGGNILKDFQLTIDYPGRMSYWLRQGDPDTHDLDLVGLTLQSAAGIYKIAAIATKNGKPTVEGVQPGDVLLQIGELALSKASWGAIYSALHGKPGESRTLLLQRDGKQFTVIAKVTAF